MNEERFARWLALAREQKVWLLAGGAVLILLVAGLWWASSRSSQRASLAGPVPVAAQGSAGAGGASAEQPSVAEPAVGGAPSAPPAGAGLGADAGARSPTVKVVFRTFPSRRALVMWGGKRLGFIDRNAPLVVERPRDSGPLDVVIRAQNYLPVHTRAYTFEDSAIDVRITPVEKKDTIYGYKEPLPPDAGAPFPTMAPTDVPE